MRIDFTSVESMRPSILAAVAALVLAATAPALAREAVLPLQVDNAFLLRLLEEQVFTDPEGSANVWQDEAGCSEIVLREPDVGSAAALVRVSSRFSAKLGAGLGNWCVGVTHWTGRVDVLMEPSVHPSMPIVTFRVVDSHLYNDAGEKTFTGTVWDWFKARVHPRLETVRVDLYGPVTELELFLPLILGGTDVERTQALIDSLRIRAVEPTPSGLRIDVGLSVPESPPDAVGPPAPVPTLTAEEVDRWQRTLDSWDGFLTFIVKRAGRDAQTVELQRVLGEILLEARYDLVEALRPTQVRDDDPVRPLFLKTWKRLAPALREASLGVPGESAVRYLSLLTAGDALTALDELGPGFGWQVSSDGLRRLARMVEPMATDPTTRSEDVDPELRRLMGFGDPLPVPTPSDVPDDRTDPSDPTDPADDSDESDESSPSPLSRLFWSPAYAAEPLDPLARLRTWVPKRDDVHDYLAAVGRVLREASHQTREAKKIDSRWHPMFEHMTLATAWKETCWRQFVRKGKQISTIESSAGALGLMQINPRVWRGLYDVGALRSDISYNARAGTEILEHYFVDYALKKREHEQPGGENNLVRATYSAYNAGPGRLSRYRRNGGHAIDRKFWDMYQQIEAGNEAAVAGCYGV